MCSAIEESLTALKKSIPIEKLIKELAYAIEPRLIRIVQGTSEDYASLILSVHIESALLAAMYHKGFITLPDTGDNTAMTSYLLLND